MFLVRKQLFNGSFVVPFFILFATSVLSQSTITMDGDKCSSDLAIISAISDADIQTATLPRRFLGMCELQNVAIAFRSADLEMNIARLQWQGDTLPEFAIKSLPSSFRVSATGIVLTKSPLNQPLWHFLRAQSQLPGGLIAAFGFSYTPRDGRLSVDQASLGFSGGNRASAALELQGVSPDLLRDPTVLGLDLRARKLVLTIDGKYDFFESLILASMPRAAREMGLEETRQVARKYVMKELTYLLARQDNSDLRKLIAEMPNLLGTVSVAFSAENGVPAARIIALLGGADPDWASDGIVLSFHYDQPEAQTSP